MFELSKQFRFDVAHSLNCEANTDRNKRIHGHSYRAEVTVAGTPNPKTGMVVDLGMFERELDIVRDTLDHRFLDEVEGLGPATLENLCLWIWKHMEKKFPNVAKVTVMRDSNTDACTYFGPNKAAA